MPHLRSHFPVQGSVLHDTDWLAVDATAQLAGAWKHKLNIYGAGTRDRLATISEYSSQYPRSPWASSFSQYASYLKRMQNVDGRKGPWSGDFVAQLDAPALRELRCMTSIDGKRYYIPKAEVPAHDSLGTTFHCVTNGAGAVRRVHGDFRTDPAASPQSVLSQDLADTIGAVHDDWETIGFTLAGKIAGDRDVDPILRVILLEQVLNSWQVASTGGENAMLSIAGALGKFNADDLAWMDPDNADANAKRDAAERLIADQLPEFEKAQRYRRPAQCAVQAA